jgi:hypothetical protein
MEVPVAAREARKARHRREVADLDYRRNVVRLRDVDGLTQATIATLVGVAQPTVQKILVHAASLSMPAEGFSGADPYEICQRYAAGLMDRAQLVDELTRWEYTPRARTESAFDDLIVDEPGSTADLEDALRHGLIDDDLFDEVADLIEKQASAQ